MKTNNAGFTALEIILVSVVVLLVGFVGYTVWQARQDNKPSTSTTQSTEPVSEEPTDATEIKKTADLDTASSDVDKLDAQSSVTEIDKLGQEVNSL